MTDQEIKIDCIEMKRKGAAKIRQETRGMSIEEELKYWQTGTAEFLEWQNKQKKPRKNGNLDTL